MPTRPKKATAKPHQSNALVNRLQPGQTPAEGNAGLVVAGLATNAVAVVEWSGYPFGADVDITACLNAVVDAAERVNRGDLGDMEAMLTAQAITLNAVFTQLSHRARLNMGEHLDAADRYMRLALKAQSQSRATIETLAAIKNPPTVFARQANIAHGPQQVNNNPSLARAGDSEIEPNELLEAHVERLDLGTAGTASPGDQALATVGSRHRPANG